MTRLLTYILLLGVAGAALAWAYWPRGAVLDGRKVDYHAIYDSFWDVACDTAVDGSDRGCYVQYVDVYRPRPDFAAAMVELVYHAGADGRPDPHLRFDIEPGLSFQASRLAVTGAAGVTPIDVSHCASNTCRMSGDTARAILAALRAGEALTLEIDEGRDSPARLSWPLGNMDTILDDLGAQRAARGLP
ncbi:hypothetical protein EI983_16670 [Roseovarius faecimaris]|uniref:Invasion associated locus B family protein n=1 Tax=Roseovarius faecimaris TaxID=2494550 RepID=A0A6I6IUC9_9RHOB|nr:invasion associated locus B family protein [Roseovarius faecimaris]QGX99812.1 hypothetical protein EI983_16670 [Roseovarius faecimaris]